MLRWLTFSLLLCGAFHITIKAFTHSPQTLGEGYAEAEAEVCSPTEQRKNGLFCRTQQRKPVFTPRVVVPPTPAPAPAPSTSGGNDAAAADGELHALLTAELTRVHAHWADATLVKAVLFSVRFDLVAAEAALADMQVATGGDAGVASDAVAAGVMVVGGEVRALTGSGRGRQATAHCDPAGVGCTVERGDLEALGDIYGMIRVDAMKATRKWLQTVRKSAAAFAQQVRAAV